MDEKGGGGGKGLRSETQDIVARYIFNIYYIPKKKTNVLCGSLY